jgi:nitrogen-specific signal transduction histidine kinase/CheY-like chemotaxis protein
MRAKNEELDAALAERDRVEEERGRLEGELRQTQRLEAVGQLAGGIAHDFNNLLAAILSYADLVADDLGDHPSRADVDEIRAAARRGATLTRKLLVFSRDVPVREEQADVAAVIGDMEGLLVRTIGEDVELRTDLPADLPPALVDAGSLEQVVMNLVVNARDALEDEDAPGVIDIAADLVVDADDDTREVRIRVTDNGPGMDADVATRAFEPFFTTKERGRGTGLGLSTVYGIVQRVGGRVRIDSVPGVGTTVEVLLPEAVGVAADDPPGSGGTVPGALPAGTVLLVEDEEPVRRAARRMLERRGMSVLEARDGSEAIELYGDARPDVLLTDVILPGGLTGADVAEVFGRDHPDLPVVFMSGYSADILARRGLGTAESSLLLSKPFDEPALVAVVTEALAARAAR